MKWPGWTGVGERTYEQRDGEVAQPSKTAWDWLQLLIVPAFLLAAVTIYNSAQADQQNRQSVQTAQEATLDAYFLQMSGLMLHNGLLTANPPTAVKAVADAITGEVVNRLDTPRKIQVVAFLSEANVRNANLSGVNLRGASLNGVSLDGANLISANLSGAALADASLSGANFSGANLFLAKLSGSFDPGANYDHTICPNGKVTTTHC